MMPTCEYKRCRRVAEKKFEKVAIGEITGDKDGFGKYWTQPVWVCNRHWLKILAKLGYKS